MTGLGAPVVIDARRTPIGTAGHALAQVGAADLAAPVLEALVCDGSGRLPDEVVLGNCMGPGGNVARVAALTAGIPDRVPAMTVDRQCGSGLAAVLLACSLVRDDARMVLAGGVESASTAPWRFWPPVPGGRPERYERAPFAPATHGDPDMGMAADLLADAWEVDRAAQDAYAARSHRLAVATRTAGGFDAELVPVAGLTHDERPRAGLTTERLRRLPVAFRPASAGGTVTVGNSCGVNDGAAATVVVSSKEWERRGRPPGLRVLAGVTSAGSPHQPGFGLVPAVEAAVRRAGVGLADLDAIEVNEAFAGQVLACCAALGLDPDRVCVEGGALALGHPWGASGAVCVVRLFSQLVRAGRGRYGLAAIAVGGGQGVALVVERCP